MEFYRRSFLTPEREAALSQYDREIAGLVGPGFPYPVRMRDWELWRILEALKGARREAQILDAGAFNTYLGPYLSRRHRRVVVSDLLRQRRLKSFFRRIGLAPKKSTEAPYSIWIALMRQAGVPVRDLDLTRIGCSDGSFDIVIALSVIEHIPDVERALSEMYRILAPGGKILLTTDCAPEPSPIAGGVRYFSEGELERLFLPYPVTSPRNRPDFSAENWCYARGRPIVTVFVEITKPA